MLRASYAHMQACRELAQAKEDETLYETIEKWVKKETQAKPCQLTCEKCGTDLVHLRFYAKGEDTNPFGPNQHEKTTEWVDRKMYYRQPAKKDCLVAVCQCCGFKWDMAPMKKETE